MKKDTLIKVAAGIGALVFVVATGGLGAIAIWIGVKIWEAKKVKA